MNIFSDLAAYQNSSKEVVLSIGNFDGLHCGHQTILNRMAQFDLEKVIITFSNHPSEILRNKPSPLICSFSHKLLLFKNYDITTIFTLAFTSGFAKKTAEEFLSSLKVHIPFRYLILGHDAVMGHNREGNRQLIEKIANKYQFSVEYLPPVLNEEVPISSSLIRKSLNSGDFRTTEKLLGRKYSIYSLVQKGLGQGRNLGFRTLNLCVDGLCLPPRGVYAVEVIHQNKKYVAVANLGLAPTIKNITTPLLEIHLLDCDQDFYGEYVEVIFNQFLREEKKFSSIALLQQQIALDIKTTRLIFKT